MALKNLRILLAWTALFGASMGLAAQALTPQVSLVTRLYEDFAFEAVIDSPALTRPEFVFSPRATLNRYLTPGLTRSLLRDRRLQAKTKEESSLDFAPLWGSQDPVGSSVIILKTNKPEVVEVQITQNIGASHEPDTRSIFYTLKMNKVGWRIDDILYPDLGERDQVTLRKSLTAD